MIRKLLLDRWFAVVLSGFILITTGACTSGAEDEGYDLEADAADAAEIEDADAFTSDDSETTDEENTVGNPIENGTSEQQADTDIPDQGFEAKEVDAAEAVNNEKAEPVANVENTAFPTETAELPPAQTAPAELPLNQAAVAPAAPAPDVTAGITGRLVRYVKADGTVIHAEANASSSAVGQLNQGTSIVVMINNGWAEIAPGHFVEASALSESIVAKKKTDAAWMAP